MLGFSDDSFYYRLASENYGKTLLAKDVNEAKTVGGLLALLK